MGRVLHLAPSFIRAELVLAERAELVLGRVVLHRIRDISAVGRFGLGHLGQLLG